MTSPTIAAALSKRCYSMSEPHLSGYRLIIGFNTMADVQDAQIAVAMLAKAEQSAGPSDDTGEGACASAQNPTGAKPSLPTQSTPVGG